MNERWRRPLKVLSVEDANEAFITSDGRIQRAANVILDEDSIERLRLGYACLKCFEPFPVPWPERCGVCGAPIARDQRVFFEHEFAGTVEIGSRVSLEDELAQLPERAAEEEAKRRAT